jgi:2-succinyl-5-enolpyruvyl-6-hydroxy-3-cyclohexene-1-carboxylate synthase
MDGIPMILLTADRPPELRDTGANQTIDQADFFGRHVRWHFDMPPPTDDIPMSFVLTTVDQAVYRSRYPVSGPVHLNCMFRKPLEPVTAPGIEWNDWIATLATECEIDARGGKGGAEGQMQRWTSASTPYTSYEAVPKSPQGLFSGGVIAELLAESGRPMIVAGRIAYPRVAESLLNWGEKNGVPVLTDVMSQGRFSAQSSAALPYHDLLLSDAGIRAELQPDFIIQIGRVPVSQRLTSWLASNPPTHYATLAPGPERLDPSHRVTHRVDCTEEETTAIFSGSGITVSPEAEWLGRWSQENHRIHRWLDRRFGSGADTDLSEQGIAWRISRELRNDDLLVLGSSMSIRHMNTFASQSGAGVRCFANRGASGIDGTIATAAGILAHEKSPMTVFLGDLALLHDLNSMALIRKTDTIIVVLNNDGGGIFSYLPIADQSDVFDPYFSTPHGFSFEGAALQFGLEHRNCETLGSFTETYRELRGRGGGGLIEIKTDRALSRTLNRQLVQESRHR